MNELPLKFLSQNIYNALHSFTKSHAAIAIVFTMFLPRVSTAKVAMELAAVVAQTVMTMLRKGKEVRFFLIVRLHSVIACSKNHFQSDKMALLYRR